MRFSSASNLTAAFVATLLLAAVLPASGLSQTSMPPAAAEFDGARAFVHAETMVEMGPRPLGSDALEANRVYIEDQLRAVGLEPWRDDFDARTPLGTIPMANIIAEVPAADGAGGPVLLLAGHYDTKKFDGVPFVGANDGASSTAVVLEAARALSIHPPPLPVWLVFFDGEEAVVSWSDADSVYGSKNLVARWAGDGTLSRVGALVLVDMVGDADLEIPREINSTTWLTDAIWETAAEIGYGDKFPDHVHAILDDHLPFIDAGIDAVDLIDFTYGPGNRYWHSPFDTLDKISGESMGIVGKVVLASLPRIAEEIAAASN